jgi:hypothetical protein
MAYSATRLPSRFPVGTKFIVEGRRARAGQAQVFKRFIEFPDGTQLSLPARTAKCRSATETRHNRRGRQAEAVHRSA